MNELTFDKEYKVLKRRDVSVGEEIELSEDEIYFVRYRNKIIISPFVLIRFFAFKSLDNTFKPLFRSIY